MATTSKAVLREQLLAARGRVADDVRAAEARLLGEHVDTLKAFVRGRDTVCAYVPVGTEPGSIDLLDRLLTLAGRVLLPVARTGPDGAPRPLRWGDYRPGALVAGRWGLLEPPAPWLPDTALGEADLVLLPALAVDRAGVRLGRGRGFYDRSLHARRGAAPLVAVVRDAELLDALPSEPHDVPMTHALTPGAGLVAVGTP